MTNGRTLGDPIQRDQGHCDDLLDSRHVELPQQPRSVQNLHHGYDVGKLLNGALLDPSPAAPAAHPDRAAGNRRALPRAWKSSGWGGGGFCRRGASYSSLCPSSPALACENAARAWAIDCCSCRQAARSRRPLRRWAAPVTIVTGDANKQNGHDSDRRLLLLLSFQTRP